MAWIRQGLKENTLGSYLNIITQDEKLLRYTSLLHSLILSIIPSYNLQDVASGYPGLSIYNYFEA